MGSYTPKDWRNATTHEGGGDTSTPISAAAIEDLETRVTDYADSLTILNAITDGYATGDGSTDDTVGLQAALDDVGSNGGILFIPNGSSFYKLTDTLTVPDVMGLRVIGESWNSTELRMTVNNKPILQTSGQFQQGLSFEELRLAYTTQQTNASHPNSVALALSGPNTTSTYYSLFRRLQIRQATKGIAVVQDAGETLQVWGNTFEDLHFAAISHSLIDTVAPVAAGAPVNRFSRISHLAEGGPDPTGIAIRIAGEARLDAIGVEDWTGQIFYFTDAVTMDSVHIERWTPTAVSAPLIQISDGTLRASGIDVDILSVDAVNILLFWVYANALAEITNVSLSIASGTGGTQYIHHRIGDTDSRLVTTPVIFTAGSPVTALTYFQYPDANTVAGTRVVGSGPGGIQSVASGATINLNYYGEVFTITGTADITDIHANSAWAERRVTLIFTGTAATNGLVDGSNLKLASTLAYTPADTITLVCDGTDWYETGRSVN